MKEQIPEEILKTTDHRPYPLPSGPWVMEQTWEDLLFAHWPIEADIIREQIPASLELDTYKGQAWISISPFKMRGVKFRILPEIPTASNFFELNVRTYVKCKDKSGIYFFSLDASSILAVIGAKIGTTLPYFEADFNVTENNGEIFYHCMRKKVNEISKEFKVSYKSISGVEESKSESLESWLTDRYCLFQQTTDKNCLAIDIHHLKWPLQKASAQIEINTMTTGLNIILPQRPEILQFSKYLKVLTWPPVIL